MGCSKNSSKMEVYSNTILQQEKHRIDDLNLHPKTTGNRRTKKISKFVEGK